MSKYNNSNIYKIFCKDTTIKEVYVGSTTNFKHRNIHHKSDCNNENGKRNLSRKSFAVLYETNFLRSITSPK